MRTTLVFAALAAALAGCGFYHWQKEGADNAAFQRDNADCQREATAEQFQACMERKGWKYSSGW